MALSGESASRTVVVTGAAGFIGSHVAEAFAAAGSRVFAVDCYDDYYDPARKHANQRELLEGPQRDRITFAEFDVRDEGALARLFAPQRVDCVVHLAALAGVSNSLLDPRRYFDVNVGGTIAILRTLVAASPNAARPAFILASTSSVYGATTNIPFVESDPCDRPLAPYPASKRAAELIAYTFHHVHAVPTTVLRFFSVYGPRGRPDMIAYKLADSMYRGDEIPLYEGGDMYRDWTFVTDIAAGVVAAAERKLDFEVINLGRGTPVRLADMVDAMERLTGRSPRLRPEPAPSTDIRRTYASIEKARRLLGYEPRVDLDEGLRAFVSWYRRAVLAGLGTDPAGAP